ncbi:MAG TPA: efflux transporter outer membrane subunit [Arenicellales bacterium]|nr:efflux transporter outer membrane subunit [Arenicellales bacterium]
MHKFLATLIMTALLAACAAGPDYRRPETPEPDSFTAAGSSAGMKSDERRFWQGFGDPMLSELVETTLDANQTLAGAVARYERVAALLAGARRDRWPSVTAGAGASEMRPSEVEQGTGPEEFETYEAGLAAEWELDLFGRLRRITESRRAELQAAAADVDAVRVALVGQAAASYFRLRGLQQQLDVVRANVRLQEESLDIVTARVEAGRGTDFDRVRARAQLERIRAELPALDAEIRAAMHRIAVIAGQPPARLVPWLSAPRELPDERPVISPGTPGELLRRRPDIAAAERRVAAATARIGVASADLYPRFTLSGLLGTVAGDPGDLFSSGSESGLVALGIDWSFLDRGRVRARIDAADAETREAIADYRQAVLTALEATETRLVRYQRSQDRTARLESAVASAERAVELARTRFERGFIDYFEVLAAEQELVAARNNAVRSRTDEVLAMVDVYRALAGAPPEQIRTSRSHQRVEIPVPAAKQ